MIEIPREAYPLTWPAAQKRTPSWQRKASAFDPRGFGLIRDELMDELRRLGAQGVILSSNLPVKLDGLPYASAREPDDPGIAVYFKRHKVDYVIACDSYDKTWKNLRAIHKTIEALRTIERHGGSGLMEQAFTGFAALPSHQAEPSWWDVLGVSREATLTEIEAAHERLAKQHHPDIGGDHETMARVNRARDVAREERS